MKKLLCFVMIAAICFSVFTGIKTKASYTDNVFPSPSSPDTVFCDFASINISDDTIQQLLDADIIVKAIAVSEPILEYLAVKTTLKVTQSYKGEIDVGDSFDYYQDAMFVASGILGAEIPQYRKFTPFNIMQNGKEYIIFANNKNVHAAYAEKLGHEVYRYVNPMLGISYFESEMTMPPIIDKKEMENGKITYMDIKDYEFVCYDEEQRITINNFKEKINAKLS